MRKAVVLLLFLFVVMLGIMALAPMLEQPPALRRHNVPGEFDATRAKARVAFVLGDQQPHPADSAANDQVRTRLVATLEQMGLDPIVRDEFACNELFKERGVACARVRNVVAVLGAKAGKALLLNAHYDSVPVGPGAADDGIGVATLLEVGAILKNQPPKRPVVLLFNEGEELGLVGARAFLDDPLSRSVDSLINLEARGVRGPVNMFETSRPNAAAIALFASAVKRPAANSLSTDVYRLMSNYTDVNSFSERGWLILNLAPIGNETRYHSPGDDVAALDPATLQHMGDQTLALVQRLANGSPVRTSGNLIFMDIANRTLISLPITDGVILLALLLIGFAAAALERGRGGSGTFVVLGTIVGSGLIAWAAPALIGVARPGMFWRAQPIWIHLATYGCVLLAGAGLVATIGRSMSIRQLRAIFWLLFLAIGAVIGLYAPGGIVFFLFPPTVAGFGMIANRWWRQAELACSIVAIIILYLTWGAMLGLLEELLNDGPIWVFAPLAALLLVPALIEAKPLIDEVGPRAATSVAAILVLLGWTAAAAAPAYSADRQQRFVIQQVTNAATHKSWWSILNDGAPLPKAFGSGWKRGKLPLSDALRWIKPAVARPGAVAPAVQLLSEVDNGDERTLTVRLAANNNDEVEILAPEDALIKSAGVARFVRPIDQDSDGIYSLGCSGRSCDGAIVQLTTEQPKPIRFLILGSRGSLPASAASLLFTRPRFARPQYTPDASIAFKVMKL